MALSSVVLPAAVAPMTETISPAHLGENVVRARRRRRRQRGRHGERAHGAAPDSLDDGGVTADIGGARRRR